MPNYDDLFTGQPTQQEEKPFDKTAWACLLYTSPSPRDRG